MWRQAVRNVPHLALGPCVGAEDHVGAGDVWPPNSSTGATAGAPAQPLSAEPLRLGRSGGGQPSRRFAGPTILSAAAYRGAAAEPQRPRGYAVAVVAPDEEMLAAPALRAGRSGPGISSRLAKPARLSAEPLGFAGSGAQPQSARIASRSFRISSALSASSMSSNIASAAARRRSRSAASPRSVAARASASWPYAT